MDKQVTSTPPPNTWKWGGSGYLYLHYWPPVDWEPAINVDMVNQIIKPFSFINLSIFQYMVHWTTDRPPESIT